jgi:hypothetical protein
MAETPLYKILVRKTPQKIVQICLTGGHIGHIGHIAIVNPSIYPAVKEMVGIVTATYSDAITVPRRVQYLKLTASQNIISMVITNT